mgnify:CR=1 FL=1
MNPERLSEEKLVPISRYSSLFVFNESCSFHHNKFYYLGNDRLLQQINIIVFLFANNHESFINPNPSRHKSMVFYLIAFLFNFF